VFSLDALKESPAKLGKKGSGISAFWMPARQWLENQCLHPNHHCQSIRI
jgi:hypothetical protein